MKFLLLSLALVAAVMADVSELGGGYDYPAPAAAESVSYGGEAELSSSVPDNTYIPPAASAPANTYIPKAASASANTYIPPAASAPANTYIPPAGSESAVNLADDGYRYKTQRRRVYRRRF